MTPSYDYAVRIAQEAIGALAAAGGILSHDDTLSQYQRWQGEALWDAAQAADQTLEALMTNGPKTWAHVMYYVEKRAVHDISKVGTTDSPITFGGLEAPESALEALEPWEDLGVVPEPDEDVWRGDR
jgi:hypothetical protein